MRIGSIVVRCQELETMLGFWSEALHYVPRNPPEPGWVVLRDPRQPALRGPDAAEPRLGCRASP